MRSIISLNRLRERKKLAEEEEECEFFSGVHWIEETIELALTTSRQRGIETFITIPLWQGRASREVARSTTTERETIKVVVLTYQRITQL